MTKKQRYYLLPLQTPQVTQVVILKERSGYIYTCLVLTVLQEIKRRVRILLNTKYAIHLNRVKTQWKIHQLFINQR